LPQKQDISPSLAGFLLCLFVLVGLWLRLSGLGDRPLARDEYYFIKSVQNIIEYGVPRFSTGGYYARGILLQYLTTISIFLFGDGGFAYRLPSALFGVGTIVMGYLLGRQFFSRSWSLVLAFILTLSSWEIEFSRFARMYSAFQFATVCFFWSLYRYSFQGKSSERYITVAFAMIAILTHELGVLLMPFLFLPLPAWFNRNFRSILLEQRVYIVVSLVVIGIGYLATHDLRSMGVHDSLPRDFVESVGRNLHWWAFGSSLFGEKLFFSGAALAAFCLLFWYISYVVRSPTGASSEEYLLGWLLVVSLCGAVFHQFAVSAVAMLVIVLREPKMLLKRPYVYMFMVLGGIILSWSILLMFNKSWINSVGLGNIMRSYARSYRLAFFAFPDLYIPVINVWAQQIPVLGCFLGVTLVWQIIYIRKMALGSLVRNPVVPIVIIVLAFGVFLPFEFETRYCYFIYPLGLCVVVLSAIQLGEKLRQRFIMKETIANGLVAAMCLLIFAASEDFNTFHLFNLNSDSVAYRTGRYERYSRHWYERWDFRKPAELVNEAASMGSRIVVMGNANTAAVYLKPEFAVYWDREDVRFPDISREGGTKELWSDKQLLNTIEDVKDYTQNAESVWLLLYPGWGSLDPDAIWCGRVRKVEVYKPGRDRRVEVWKIQLG